MPVIRPSRRASLLGTACLLAALGAYLAPPGRAADRPRVLPGADPVPIVHPPSGPNRGHAVTFDPNVMSIEQLVNKIVEVKNRKDDLEKLQKHKLAPVVAEITQLPKTEVDVDGENARKTIRIVEMLDDHDDVQHVYYNAHIPEEVMAELAKE